ncbi:MAG: MATE family efflux transporter [Thermodesulfobacteriota bacterium]|nr:MATE family efflux transporter [Thermodesulfobacteriota bacterium]
MNQLTGKQNKTILYYTMTTATNAMDNAPTLWINFIPELREIIILALPIFISQLAIIATGFIDTTMAGHFSNNALAGAAIGSSICFPLIIALNGVLMSVTPITAQLVGAGRYLEIGPKVRQALWIGLFLSILMIFGKESVAPLLGAMKLSPEVTAIVEGYLKGISIGFPAIAGYFVLKSFAEGFGKTRPQMVISIITVLFNYFANDILIHGKYGFPQLGGAGCGWASGLTFWVFLLCMVFYLFSNEISSKSGLFSKFGFPSLQGMSEIVILGLPIGGTLFMECSIFACITLFISILGPVIVGGHQIALNFSGMIFSIPLSIGMALTIRTGHAIGRKDPKAARFTCITGCLFAMAISMITINLTLFFSEQIVSIYTKDPDVSKIAVSLLFFGALYQFSDSIMTTSQGALRGYKDANMTLILTFVAYWVITMPLGYTIAMTDLIIPGIGARGFWLSLIAGLTISGIFLVFRLNFVSAKHIKSKYSASTPSSPILACSHSVNVPFGATPKTS